MPASIEGTTPERQVVWPAGAPQRDESAVDTAGARASVATAGQRLPDFFIVGHGKCGTTALYQMLKRHPQIYVPDNKDPRFFAPEQWSRYRQQASAEAKSLHTLEGYLSLFSAASPEQRVGEGTTSYLRSTSAARRIAEAQPAARIIAILREPASYLHSFHLQVVKSGVETQRDLRKAIALVEARREGKHIPRSCHSPATLMYTDHVRYVEQLRRYHAAFPAERVLVLIYDDYRGDNEATIRKVLRFLEVDETPPEQLIETKRVKAVRLLALHQLANEVRVARRNSAAAGPLARVVNALTPAVLRSEAFRAMWRSVVYSAPRPPDEDLMLELRRRFRPEVVALSEYLGRDLVTLWGYDAIA
jgi:putative intracellular protease/amidase